MLIQLNPNEKIIAIFRKHWFTITLQGITFFFMALAPAVLYIIIKNVFGIDFGYSILPQFIYGIWILLMWIGFFIAWTNYVLDYWVLTNERLIDVEQISLFSRKVSGLSLERMQDVTVKTAGLVYTLMDIGTVYIQTAGAEKEFHIEDAPHPQYIKDILMRIGQEKLKSMQNIPGI